MPGITILVSCLLGAFLKKRDDFYATDIRIILILVFLNLAQFFILVLSWHYSFA